MLYADKEAHGVARHVLAGRGAFGQFYGKGNKAYFIRHAAGCQRCMIFVKSRHDGVAIGCHLLVQPSLTAVEPIAHEDVVLLGMAYDVAEVEIAVAERLAVEAGLYIIMVHTERAEHDAAVVAAQIFIENAHTLRSERQEYGVNQLHDVVAAKLAELLD